MESIAFISWKNVWGPNVAIRVRGMSESGTATIVMGKSAAVGIQRDTIERWSKGIDAKEVAWIDDLEINEIILRVKEIMAENGVFEAIIISEDVKHESVADLVAGVEFVRAFEWSR